MKGGAPRWRVHSEYNVSHSTTRGLCESPAQLLQGHLRSAVTVESFILLFDGFINALNINYVLLWLKRSSVKRKYIRMAR